MMRNATSSHLVSGLASHGVSRCLRVHACVFMRTHFAVRVIFDCVCLRWGRCLFSCSFHDHYITCGIFAATGVYFHPCESWSKLLFKHRLETEIFSDAQTASPIKMIELSLINNSYWKHGIMWQRCHFIRKKMNTGERITGLWPKIPNTTFCLVCFLLPWAALCTVCAVIPQKKRRHTYAFIKIMYRRFFDVSLGSAEKVTQLFWDCLLSDCKATVTVYLWPSNAVKLIRSSLYFSICCCRPAGGFSSV